ncbi:MAG: hypothetical protein ACLTTO_09040 [Lachnospiraceae bacterium]
MWYVNTARAMIFMCWHKAWECSEEELNDTSVVCEKIRLWLLNSQNRKKGEDSLSKFLSKLDEFDLNEYHKSHPFR